MVFSALCMHDILLSCSVLIPKRGTLINNDQEARIKLDVLIITVKVPGSAD
jgi:hypothetical protein